jgi:methyl-accepting chemotaxis protein
MTTATVGPEEEKLLDTHLYSRRAQFALIAARYVALADAVLVILLVITWLFLRQYLQLLIIAGISTPLVVVAWLYPRFHRRDQVRVGLYVFFTTLLFSLFVPFLLIPEIILTTAIGCVLILILGNLVLEDKDRLRLTVVCVLGFAVDTILQRLLPVTWFPSLGQTYGGIVTILFGSSSLVIAAIIVRSVLLEQENLFRQSQRANLEIERRAAVEKELREHLQAVAKEYVEYMAQVGQGDLVVRLALSENGQGAEDPLIALGHNLNQMVASLHGMSLGIREAASGLSTAAAEILASTTQQASGASEQSAAISQTTTTVEEVKAIAEQSVEWARQVMDMSERTVEVSYSGKDAVAETIVGMGQIRERVEGIAENIVALLAQAQRIGEIIATVDEIAAQSNVLALNASVEAARAGEYGKGFAVVAVEVRNLARQSQQATEQVRGILSEVQKGIGAAVTATEEGTKVVEEGVRLVEQAQEVITRLGTVIEESAQVARQMAAGGRQQVSGVGQIAMSMQNINQATVQNLASTRQAEKAASDLNDLARSLTETVEQYRL